MSKKPAPIRKTSPPAILSPAQAATIVGPTTLALTRRTTPQKGSAVVYSLPAGLRGTVKFARSLFALQPPDSLTIEGHGFAAPSVAMTKEERAAARAAMTPRAKAERARVVANRAMARAAKLEAAAASS